MTLFSFLVNVDNVEHKAPFPSSNTDGVRPSISPKPAEKKLEQCDESICLLSKDPKDCEIFLMHFWY